MTKMQIAAYKAHATRARKENQKQFEAGKITKRSLAALNAHVTRKLNQKLG